jgi:uncharacterized protein
VEHFPEVVLESIKKSAATYEWFMNEWIHLVVVHPKNHDFYLFQQGEFVGYEPLQKQIEVVSDIATLLESHQDNFPVYFIK